MVFGDFLSPKTTGKSAFRHLPQSEVYFASALSEGRGDVDAFKDFLMPAARLGGLCSLHGSLVGHVAHQTVCSSFEDGMGRPFDGFVAFLKGEHWVFTRHQGFAP